MPEGVQAPSSPGSSVVRVYFNDLSFKTFKVTDETTCLDLCKGFGKKLGLPPHTVKHFCLNVVQDGVAIHSLGNNSRPIRLHKEYIQEVKGWGTTNHNCFLFGLKSESAKRMTLCLKKPERSIERLPTKPTGYRSARVFTLTADQVPSYPPTTPATASLHTPPRSPLPPLPSNAVQDEKDRRTREFATTKLQGILDIASKNEEPQQDASNSPPPAEESEEETIKRFINEMDDLVNVLMQLSSPDGAQS